MSNYRSRRQVAAGFEQQARALRSQTVRHLFAALAAALVRPARIPDAGRTTRAA